MSRDRDTLISAEQNREMFDRIAKNYDAANHAISLGMDRSWRRKAICLLNPFDGGRYLDIGTGTGDLVFEILRLAPGAAVTGIDPAEQMLELAQNKAGEFPVSFVVGDAMNLPNENNTYDGIVSGFCFRNIEHRQKALVEMLRVLKPGGKLVILESTYPQNGLVRFGYRLFTPLVPIIGKMMGGGSAYKYLIASIEDFPAPDAVVEMVETAGFEDVRHRPLAFGAISIFSGRK
ncbi:MAG: ubiquinone/menaquinone biosynthesis methyltransferase [Kiritimatiellales bacterium]|nr:ubiquinone/menaquinone biosynthesis methyltransferase [Kiritimatiellales bacterium]